MTDIEKAKFFLKNEDLTLALVRGNTVYKSHERGIKPMVNFLLSKTDLAHFSAADKVVGKATAFLYVLSGVDEVYAHVMTFDALNIFEKNNIKASCDKTVAYVINREKTGVCPMESTVADISMPNEAFDAVCKKLAQLEKQNKR